MTPRAFAVACKLALDESEGLEELEGAFRALSSVESLSARQAERVAERMDRLASQLLEVSPPPAMDAVQERLSTAPASDEDFASLVDQMGPPDREG